MKKKYPGRSIAKFVWRDGFIDKYRVNAKLQVSYRRYDERTDVVISEIKNRIVQKIVPIAKFKKLPEKENGVMVFKEVYC